MNNGEVYGNWTVIEKGSPASICRCLCGTEKSVFNRALVSGSSKSCRCLKKLKITKGDRFGLWVVIGDVVEIRYGTHPKRAVKCRCDCGVETVVVINSLANGLSKSCGCNVSKAAKDANTTHGKSKTKEYSIYRDMIRRCTNENRDDYKHYGGRGIKVCDRWMESFENFLADMGPRPEGMSIDRIDNSLDYSPENCKWATQKQQTRNTRRSHNITLYGRTQCLQAWLDELGLNRATYKERVLYQGLSPEEALLKPVRKLG